MSESGSKRVVFVDVMPPQSVNDEEKDPLSSGPPQFHRMGGEGVGVGLSVMQACPHVVCNMGDVRAGCVWSDQSVGGQDRVRWVGGRHGVL